MNVAVTGATGAMGRALLEAASERGDVTVALAVARDPGEERIAGVRIDDAGQLEDLLSRRRPNALIDFTAPEASVEYVRLAAEAAVPAVVGTTGFAEDQEGDLRAASERVPVLVASNFARGVGALLRAVEAAVGALPGYDVEVLETHHSRKRDAPSGTAETILGTIESVRGGSARVYGREGEAPRSEGEIGVHARRAGTVRGEHEVLLAGDDEVLTVTHRVESRRVFAEGALDAAVWLAGQPPGWYSFADALEP